MLKNADDFRILRVKSTQMQKMLVYKGLIINGVMKIFLNENVLILCCLMICNDFVQFKN